MSHSREALLRKDLKQTTLAGAFGKADPEVKGAIGTVADRLVTAGFENESDYCVPRRTYLSRTASMAQSVVEALRIGSRLLGATTANFSHGLRHHFRNLPGLNSKQADHGWMVPAEVVARH